MKPFLPLRLLIISIFICGAAGCASEPVLEVEQSYEPIIPIPEVGEWILISGVDEHGLIAEDELQLLVDPEPDAGVLANLPTGVPVLVEEKINTGPQNLRRFYRVLALNGMSGWISDYYVRRVVYIFDISRQTVRLYDAPDGEVAADITNIYPVAIVDASRPDWWEVQTADGQYRGWILAEQVKESPEPEFLFVQDLGLGGDGQHDH